MIETWVIVSELPKYSDKGNQKLRKKKKTCKARLWLNCPNKSYEWGFKPFNYLALPIEKSTIYSLWLNITLPKWHWEWHKLMLISNGSTCFQLPFPYALPLVLVMVYCNSIMALNPKKFWHVPKCICTWLILIGR